MEPVSAVAFLPPARPLAEPAAAAPAAAAPDSLFAQLFAGQLGAVNGQLKAAEQGLQQLASGEAVSLHQVMLRLEEARLSFQLVAQVRNRLLEGYQEMLRMQL